jgi:opacity protein-like surface antigen
MEWAFSPNFSLQAEYDFVDFGTKNVTFTGGAGFPTTTYSNRQFINELKLGINARFSVYLNLSARIRII